MAGKTAAPDKAAAARSERKPKPKKLTFKGLKLTLPPELPETILFDFVDLEDAGNNPIPMFRLLKSVLGDEQFLALRHANANGTVQAEDLPELLEVIFGKYGLTPGESEASQAS